MGINRSRISHYFQFVKHQFWVHSFITTLFCSFSCYYNKVLLKFYFTHVMFLFHDLEFEIKLTLVHVLGKSWLFLCP